MNGCPTPLGLVCTDPICPLHIGSAPKRPAVRRGETFPWSSMCPPPNGYRFVHDHRLVMVERPMPIVAMRDHGERPRLPEKYLSYYDDKPDRQAEMLRRPQEAK